MFCKNCGKEIADDSKFCSFCGKSTENEKADLNDVLEDDEKETDKPKTVEEKSKKHVCPSCGSGNLKIEQKKFKQDDGCMFVILMLFCVFLFPPLLFIPVLVLAYKLISPGEKVFVCQNCGEEWDVQNDKKPVKKAKDEFSAKEVVYSIIIWGIMCLVIWGCFCVINGVVS